MTTMCKVTRVSELSIESLQPLVTQSIAEGYSFIDRLGQEWLSGANRFDKEGEFLLGVFKSTGLLGVCGLNQDPYSDDRSLGRSRHLMCCHPSAR